MTPRDILLAHLRENDPRLLNWAAEVLALAPLHGLDEALRLAHLPYALAA